MYYEKLPYGEPIYFEGKYEEDSIYDLYIQMITCSFKLKKGKIPTIQIKNNISFMPNEYVEDSGDRPQTLILTSVDLDLFLNQYDVDELYYECGWKFKSKKGIFKEYIDKWIEEKNRATIEKNEGNRTLAKLMLNALYGKFASSTEIIGKEPYLDENDIVRYKNLEKEYKEPVYIPMASFITAYARKKTIETSQAIKDYSIKKYGIDKYYYSDTDSVHTGLSIEELKQFCEIDDVELGKWKHEGSFSRAKFIRQKCYIEDIIGKGIKITCAGLPSRCYQYVTWENFKSGFTCGGKLTFKHVKGGVILKETEFTIQEDKTNEDIIEIKNVKERTINDR